MTLGERIRWALFSPDELRLRAGWRLAGQGILMLGLSVFFACPAGVVFLAAPEYTPLALILATAIPTILSVLAARKWLDRRSVVSLGLQFDSRSLRDVLVGVGIAIVQIGLIFGLEIGLGWARVSGFAWTSGTWLSALGWALGWLLLYLAVGFYEELLSRGYHFQNLEEGLNTGWAVLISSAFFGIMHLFNPNANWISTLGITLAGAYFAFTYLRTRRLWLPAGIHFGWNFFLGTVAGFPVSGMDSFHLIELELGGPALWTGGKFGPEAGLIVLPALALGVGLVWLYTRSRELDQRTEDERERPEQAQQQTAG